MMRAIWNVVMPGALAGAAAITADQIVEGEPLVAALAAAVAAVAGALLQEREDDMVSRPAQADAREPGLTPPEPQPTPPRGAQPAELPLGLGRAPRGGVGCGSGGVRPGSRASAWAGRETMSSSRSCRSAP
ncbi:MAG: hypothetical protein AAFR52_20030, partial [Pseudomonadota bacterium]